MKKTKVNVLKIIVLMLSTLTLIGFYTALIRPTISMAEASDAISSRTTNETAYTFYGERYGDNHTGYYYYKDGIKHLTFCYQNDKKQPTDIGIAGYQKFDYFSADVTPYTIESKEEVAALLYAGYPIDGKSYQAQFATSDDEARYLTQLDLWDLTEGKNYSYLSPTQYDNALFYYAQSSETAPRYYGATGNVTLSGDATFSMNNGVYRTETLSLSGNYTGGNGSITLTLPKNIIAFNAQTNNQITTLSPGDTFYLKHLSIPEADYTEKVGLTYDVIQIWYYKAKDTADQDMLELEKTSKTMEVTLTKTPQKTTALTVIKNWSDGNQIHPSDNVTIRLYANDEYTGKSITLNAESNWRGIFDDLPKNNANGEMITYSVSEDLVNDYDTEYHYDDSIKTVTVINTKKSQTTPDHTQIAHKKNIDWLGDGTSNPDTNVSDEDAYRLYLDISGYEEPIDLLMMVDRSGSMTNTDMYDGMSRSEAIVNLLNGTRDSPGFIEEYLSMNSDNNIAIGWFDGQRTENYTPPYYNSKDAGIAHDWTKQTFAVDNSEANGLNHIGGKHGGDYTIGYGNSTNYMAGFWQITDMLKDPKIADNGHKKLVVFLSDGIPTRYVYVDDDTNVATYADYQEHDGDGTLIRGGNGGSGYNNPTICDNRTRTAFNDFVANNPKVTFSTIAYSTDATAATNLLSDMALQGGGLYYSAETADALNSSLRKIIEDSKPTQIGITDYLSQYVQWMNGQADLKVTRKDKNSGEETVLWQGSGTSGSIGSATVKNFDKNGTTIIQNITFIPSARDNSTGTVNVAFNPNFHMGSSYTYTLSFNATVTKNAYEKYAENKENGDGGYMQILGDPKTDYGQNTSSSEQPGFHSNYSAHISYVLNGTSYEEEYSHPVVQVHPGSISILKTGENRKPLGGVEFKLFKATASGNQWTPVNPEIPYTTGITATDGRVIFSNLSPGTYLLYETKAAAGYVLPTEPWKVTISNGFGVIPGITPENGIFEIQNTLSFTLPETGGTGLLPFYLSGSFLIFLAITIGYFRKRC